MITVDGKEWFGATQSAKALGYSNPHDAIAKHCRAEGIAFHEVLTQGGAQQVKFINEGNLYRLITKSRLPEAEKFETWLFEEVLPTIRKTGGYVANEDMFINTYLPHADEQTKIMFKATLENVRKLNEKITIMQPKADYFDALVDRNLLTSFRDTAKELKVKERDFINWLLEKKYVFRDQKGKLKPYAAYVPDLFNIKEWGNDERAGTQTLVTPKGRETFRLLLQKLARTS